MIVEQCWVYVFSMKSSPKHNDQEMCKAEHADEIQASPSDCLQKCKQSRMFCSKDDRADTGQQEGTALADYFRL